MQPGNFSFPETKLQDLAALDRFAEQYVHPDPDAAGMKLRLFAERWVKIVYQELGLQQPDDDSFLNLLRYLASKKVKLMLSPTKLLLRKICHLLTPLCGGTLPRNP